MVNSASEAVLSDKSEKKSELKGKLYIESYGCQMNFSDSEIVASILGDHGFCTVSDPKDADVILLDKKIFLYKT